MVTSETVSLSSLCRLCIISLDSKKKDKSLRCLCWKSNHHSDIRVMHGPYVSCMDQKLNSGPASRGQSHAIEL